MFKKQSSTNQYSVTFWLLTESCHSLPAHPRFFSTFLHLSVKQEKHFLPLSICYYLPFAMSAGRGGNNGPVIPLEAD